MANARYSSRSGKLGSMPMLKMAKGIAPVLDVIGADFTEAGVEAPKIGLVKKSQKAWG
jgi:hypothetical protein